MHRIFILFFTLLISGGCQDFGELELLRSLPASLKEVSGMELAADKIHLWAINDSANEAKLFLYDPNENTVKHTIEIVNGSNKDWEDLATDDEGNVYIGDFGNNRNSRKDLVIYTLPNALTIETTAAEALITKFSFEDQKAFPPKKKDRNFDVEAFIHYKSNFYLFTRNRSSDFDGTTKLYRVPAQPGTFKAELLDEYKTCSDSDDCMVTAASFHAESGKLALLSYNKVWILSDFSGDAFFDGKVEKIKLGHSSQKESISFQHENTLLIADETTGIEGGNLYRLQLD